MLLKDTKVYIVLEHFDKYEQNRCRKYIQSPYFNSNEQLVLLYDIISRQVIQTRKNELTKKDVWKKLHQHKAYDDARFRKYLSDLLKLVEGYLSQQLYEANPLVAATHLIKTVEKKKMKLLYDSSIRKAKYLSNKNQYLSAEYFYNQYKIEDFSFEIMDYDVKRDQKPNYEEIIHNLDQFFLLEKLRLYCGILSRKAVSNYEYEIAFIDEVIEYVSENLARVAPTVEIYYRIYLSYTNSQDVESYYRLKELLKQFSPQMPREEAYHIYLQVINFCTKKIKLNIERDKFLKEMFDLYKGMIQNGVIYIDGFIASSVFKNVITLGTGLHEFEWVENFINENKDKLPKDQRENTVSFNLARLYFMQRKYEKVIELLREVEYSEIALNLESRTMLLMTYYDTDEFEPLDAFLESFRVYLNRHKEIPKRFKDYYKNLIKFTKKLTRVIPGDREAVAKIKEEIEATEGFRVKWLEEKIAEMER